MAVACKCDRCGGLYSPYNEEENSRKINGFYTTNIRSGDRHYYADKLIDLCPQYCNEFVHWFEEKGIFIDLSNSVDEHKHME